MCWLRSDLKLRDGSGNGVRGRHRVFFEHASRLYLSYVAFLSVVTNTTWGKAWARLGQARPGALFAAKHYSRRLLAALRRRLGADRLQQIYPHSMASHVARFV